MTIELTKEEIQAIYNMIQYCSGYISTGDEPLRPELLEKFYQLIK